LQLLLQNLKGLTFLGTHGMLDKEGSNSALFYGSLSTGLLSMFVNVVLEESFSMCVVSHRGIF